MNDHIITKILGEIEFVLGDMNSCESGISEPCSSVDVLKGLRSVLKDERAMILLPRAEWTELCAKPKEKGVRLKELVERKSNRKWTTDELLEFSEYTDMLYGRFMRERITLEDKLYLATLPYKCMWGSEDQPYGHCEVSDDLWIDHVRASSRGVASCPSH